MTSKVYSAKLEEKSKLALKNLDVAWMCRDTSGAILKWTQVHVMLRKARIEVCRR